jgi:ABC-type sugar transport system, permease component
MVRDTKGYRIFSIFNYIFIGIIALGCLLPILNVLAISFSESGPAAAGIVKFWPVKFSLYSYQYCLGRVEFVNSLEISVVRVILGTLINVFMTVLCAYPLSKESTDFKARTFYVWIFVFTMLFGGGLIPTYLMVKNTHLINSLLALVIPCAVPVFNVIIMLNFFRGLPKALEESAFIDGAGHWTILWKLYFPLSKASIATITLFSLVGHWNSWFDGMIYLNDVKLYPMATYLQGMVVRSTINKLMDVKDLYTIQQLLKISDQTTKAAMIFIGTVPILCAYPFLQKYFTAGVILGSVKE